jgi:hypothetical protein
LVRFAPLQPTPVRRVEARHQEIGAPGAMAIRPRRGCPEAPIARDAGSRPQVEPDRRAGESG